MLFAPHPDELLSSFLCRTAYARGYYPYSFSSAVLQRPSFWARDADRGAIPWVVGEVAMACGQPEAIIREATLAEWIERLTPARFARARCSAVVPWIAVAGVYHRERRGIALQFCPGCLRDHGYVRKAWRLAFQVVCVEHGLEMADRCPRCEALFVPHRSVSRVDRCHQCYALLGLEDGHRVALAGPEASLQVRLQADLESQKDAAWSRVRDFRSLLSVVAVANGDVGPGIERSNIKRRLRLLGWLAEVVHDWPRSFRDFCTAHRLTQCTFRNVDRQGALADEVRMLPPGARRQRSPAPVALLGRLAELERRKPPHWRSTRAALMSNQGWTDGN